VLRPGYLRFLDKQAPSKGVKLFDIRMIDIATLQLPSSIVISALKFKLTITTCKNFGILRDNQVLVDIMYALLLMGDR
jgi:hypothetical protein